ncbi:MAG: MBL fold hydrolase [Planctomycetota bacterium]|mgnify:CR=1 FL=1|nr:MAG: MBL fold hydrolase [Planctomycetota bacterium]
MKITIVYDNEAKEGLKSGWGFSCLVENDKNILFDTGNSGPKLLYNLQKLQIDPQIIDTIVLSHNHWDHTGGLKTLQKVNSNANVIGPKDFSDLKDISEEVFTTGALGSWPKEQSLVIRTEKGNIVITGCAHPGLDKILQEAKTLGEIHGVIGGFHGFSDLDKLAGIELLGPCHCTRYISEIRQRYPQHFRQICAGSIIEI